MEALDLQAVEVRYGHPGVGVGERIKKRRVFAWKERANSTAALFTLWLHVSQRGREDANLSSGQQTHESWSELAGLLCSAAPRAETPLDVVAHFRLCKHTHTQADLIKIKHNQVSVS